MEQLYNKIMVFLVLKNYDCNGIETHKNLVLKQTLSYLTKQTRTILIVYFVADSSYIICTKEV